MEEHLAEKDWECDVARERAHCFEKNCKELTEKLEVHLHMLDELEEKNHHHVEELRHTKGNFGKIQPEYERVCSMVRGV